MNSNLRKLGSILILNGNSLKGEFYKSLSSKSFTIIIYFALDISTYFPFISYGWPGMKSVRTK